MILDAHSGLRGVLVNADTGQRIPLAVWADTETGEYEAFRTADGKTPLKDERGKPIKYRGRANLRFVASSAPSLPSVSVAAPPGEAGQDARPARFSQPRPTLVSKFKLCEAKGCYRQAEWETGDEVEQTPEIGPDGQRYERGTVTVRHLYCSWHYRFPLTTSVRGVTNEVEVTARPQ